ncbi:MAG: triose-phosphate isomerase [Deltaproteobacteria bacterium]|nr:triose-phosphate isomerase [Deltaproteobacteria bacterium]
MIVRTPLIAGNWKMNLTLTDSVSLIKSIAEAIQELTNVDVLVTPPYTSLSVVKETIGDARIALGAQNMHWESKGAFTGEISGLMLVEAGCTHVILGHSERRSLFQETNEMVNKKVKAALEQGLIPIVCIGETLEEREGHQTFDVIQDQLNGSLAHFLVESIIPRTTILAYEPVWAIGTGKTATPEQAQDVHQYIRHWVEGHFGKDTADHLRILYGGSVKPDNAGELMSMPDIDGALVGGASLRPEQFIPIIRF